MCPRLVHVEHMRCVSNLGGDILDGSPAGQREAARRALQAQGVEIIADAMVTRVERASSAQQPEQLVTEEPSTSQPASAPSVSAHVEPYRKAVHVRLSGNLSKASTLLFPLCAECCESFALPIKRDLEFST